MVDDWAAPLLGSMFHVVSTGTVAHAILESECRYHSHRSDVASCQDPLLQPKDIVREDRDTEEAVVANDAQDMSDDHFEAATP